MAYSLSVKGPAEVLVKVNLQAFITPIKEGEPCFHVSPSNAYS